MALLSYSDKCIECSLLDNCVGQDDCISLYKLFHLLGFSFTMGVELKVVL